MHGRLFNSAIIALCMLIIVGACLSAYFVTHLDRREIVHIALDEETEETVSFEDLSLIPGEKTSYTVSIYGDVKGECDVFLSFRADTAVMEEKNTLDEFLYVQIAEGDSILYDEPLEGLINNGSLILKKLLEPNEKVDLTVCYYLPSDIGNEAQGAKTSITLAVRASNIEE